VHEFSLMADLFRKMSEISNRNGNRKIVTVRVKLGALSHITPHHFEEHFIDFSKGTPADGAKLEIVQLDDRNDPNAQSILLESVDLDAQ